MMKADRESVDCQVEDILYRKKGDGREREREGREEYKNSKLVRVSESRQEGRLVLCVRCAK